MEDKLTSIGDHLIATNKVFESIQNGLDKMIHDFDHNPVILETWNDDEPSNLPGELFVIRDDMILLQIIYLKPDSLYFKVKCEEIGHKLNLNTCFNHLKTRFPNKNFTCNEVQRFYDIMIILIERANHIEGMDVNRMDCCFDKCRINHGVFSQSKINDLKYMLEAVKIMIPCYDIAHQERDDWICCSKWPIENKRYLSSTEGRHLIPFLYPLFSIKELIQYDWAYKKFLAYWMTIPTHSQIRNAIHESVWESYQIALPNDVLNIIFERLKND